MNFEVVLINAITLVVVTIAGLCKMRVLWALAILDIVWGNPPSLGDREKNFSSMTSVVLSLSFCTQSIIYILFFLPLSSMIAYGSYLFWRYFSTWLTQRRRRWFTLITSWVKFFDLIHLGNRMYIYQKCFLLFRFVWLLRFSFDSFSFRRHFSLTICKLAVICVSSISSSNFCVYFWKL